jgi:hypothetical protein
MEVVRVPALSDNYVWLLHEPQSGLTAVVDPAEVPPVNAALKERCVPSSIVSVAGRRQTPILTSWAMLLTNDSTILQLQCSSLHWGAIRTATLCSVLLC